jgi:protein-S-isoprenylcysteine O-methyltransferase Ste14
MSVFHFSEMFFMGITNNENLKADSFLLNHSVQYWLAATVSWLEFGLESLTMPWLNTNYISYIGILMCISGEIIRKLAMWHASSAFTHLIAYRKNKHHALVTDGIYGKFSFYTSKLTLMFEFSLRPASRLLRLVFVVGWNSSDALQPFLHDWLLLRNLPLL